MNNVIVGAFFIGFVGSVLMMVRAQAKFYRLAREQGAPTLIESEHIERPWLWFLSVRRIVAAPYLHYSGEAERARLEYLGWRWTMLAMFIALFIVAAIFLH